MYEIKVLPLCSRASLVEISITGVAADFSLPLHVNKYLVQVLVLRFADSVIDTILNL